MKQRRRRSTCWLAIKLEGRAGPPRGGKQGQIDTDVVDAVLEFAQELPEMSISAGEWVRGPVLQAEEY